MMKWDIGAMIIYNFAMIQWYNNGIMIQRYSDTLIQYDTMIQRCNDTMMPRYNNDIMMQWYNDAKEKINDTTNTTMQLYNDATIRWYHDAVIQHCTAWYSIKKHYTTQCNDMVWYSIVQHDTAWYSRIQEDTEWYAWCSMEQHGTACMVEHRMSAKMRSCPARFGQHFLALTSPHNWGTAPIQAYNTNANVPMHLGHRIVRLGIQVLLSQGQYYRAPWAKTSEMMPCTSVMVECAIGHRKMLGIGIIEMVSEPHFNESYPTRTA